MQNRKFDSEVRSILAKIAADSLLAKYVDSSLAIPSVFCGIGEIKLIVVGQDPTVKNPHVRQNINCVLNMNKVGSLRNYLTRICMELGLELKQNVYATNLYKNFFTQPPTQIKEVDIFQFALPYWLPLLKAEVAQYPDAAVITLGEPILAPLVKAGASEKLRDYWGYHPDWRQGHTNGFSFITSKQTHLDRDFFPFPHQPSLQKEFYRQHLPKYLHLMKAHLSNVSRAIHFINR